VSSERVGGRWRFQCDNCTEAVDTASGNFNEALAEAKAEGYRAYMLSGEWFHRCDGCSRSRS
jgi:hypothetical protein